MSREEEAAPVTFADAVSASAANFAKEEQVSSLDESGGDEAMGKERGKSNWHQVRSGAPAAASDAVEAAKQSEESSRAMAASASADGGSNASEIASIVDSVLSDLRPKIVEEIAKKLGKK
jgi:hypothetical protein